MTSSAQSPQPEAANADQSAGRTAAAAPDRAVREALLRRWGDFTLAYSAVHQPGLRYFGDERGFIAYRRQFGCTLALGDPIAPPEERARLLEAFVRRFSLPTFVQVSPVTAALLAPMKFWINAFGTETRIELAGYSFDGKEKRNLRSAYNRVQSAGYSIREASFAELDVAAIEALSLAWRKTRTVRRRESTFLNRPIVLADEPEVRKFFAFDADGRPAALGFFDPLFRDGEVIGYSTSFKRRDPKAEQKVGQAITRFAIETFQREGKEVLLLGLSPGADLLDDRFRHSRWTRLIFRFTYESRLYNRFVYPLQGHAMHKRDFRGVSEQTYFASRSPLPNLRLLALLRACKLI